MTGVQTCALPIDVIRRFEGLAERPFHVRLPAANPHFADHDILELQPLGFGGDGECVRPACPERAKLERPFQVMRGRGNFLAAKRDCHHVAFVSVTPNRRRNALLQNHVVGKQPGQLDVRAR